MQTYYLPNPEYYLLVTRDQISLPSPESIEDRGYTTPADWSVVSQCVSDLGQRLVSGTLGNGKWDKDGYGEFEIDDSALGEEELRIIGQWFGQGQPPRVDAKNTEVTNGRHRLTHCWAAEPSLPLPVRSEFFLNVEEIPYTPSIEKYVKDDATYIIENFSKSLLQANPIFVEKVQEYIDGTYDTSREWKAKKGD